MISYFISFNTTLNDLFNFETFMYKQIIPATDWYYIKYQNNQNDLVVFPLAAWALTDEEDNSIIGLISDFHSQQDDEVNKKAALTPVSSASGGLYKHKDELTEPELKALANRKKGKEKKIGFLNNF